MKVPNLSEMIENVKMSYTLLFNVTEGYTPSGFHLSAVRALVLQDVATQKPYLRVSGWRLHQFCNDATRDPIPSVTRTPLFLYLVKRYTLEYGEPQDDGQGETWFSKSAVLSILDEELKDFRCAYPS